VVGACPRWRSRSWKDAGGPACIVSDACKQSLILVLTSKRGVQNVVLELVVLLGAHPVASSCNI
jgi:hypothetical protein